MDSDAPHLSASRGHAILRLLGLLAARLVAAPQAGAQDCIWLGTEENVSSPYCYTRPEIRMTRAPLGAPRGACSGLKGPD